MINHVRNIVKKYKKIISYGIISIIITIVDVFVTFVLNQYTTMLIANTVGCICGASIQYILVIKRVFDNKKTVKTTIIFMATFLIGLLMANTIVVIGEWIFKGVNTILQFSVVKGMSIVIPFFINYFIRKTLYKRIGDKEDEKDICNTTMLQ